MNKRGIELSVNFIVILILAIVIFGGGIYLTYKIFDAGNTIREDVDAQTEARINALLDDGSPAIIPDVAKTVGRGQTAYFYLGVSDNHKREAPPAPTGPFTYRVNIDYKGGLRTNGVSIGIGESHPDTLYSKATFRLDYGERKAIPFAFVTKRDNPTGTHEYLVEVEYNDGTGWKIHGSKLKAYVTIK